MGGLREATRRARTALGASVDGKVTDNQAASPAETPASTARQPESSSSSRPPQLRRPSSSFFVRPFNRVSSRTSVFDLETTPVDDGSFQLKGFRHVSGVSGLKDDGGASKDEETIMDGPIAAQDEWKPVPPVRPTLSRPSSALSNRTLDEMSSAKVSVAAFKRGIRRPSETLDKSAADDDDEDDDVPLGMLNRHNLPRPASSASISRLASPSVASPPTGMGATLHDTYQFVGHYAGDDAESGSNCETRLSFACCGQNVGDRVAEGRGKPEERTCWEYICCSISAVYPELALV